MLGKCPALVTWLMSPTWCHGVYFYGVYFYGVYFYAPRKSSSSTAAPKSPHPRVVTRHGQSVDLDHYLDVLKTKPGALPGSTALAQARAAGTFTAAHEAFWTGARKTDGDAAGTRALIEVLLLHRSMSANDIVAGLEAALQVGAVTADVVAVEARRAAGIAGPVTASDPVPATPATPAATERRVVSLAQRRLADPAAVIAGLPADTRPAPSVTSYDELIALSRHRPPNSRSPHETLTEETA